jgi:hypothetical protein
MRPASTPTFVSLAVVTLATAAAWTTVGSAQGQRGGAASAAQAPPPIRLRLQVTQVRPDMSNAYQEVIKNEVIPALKKAGQPWQWMFTTGAVGPGGTFVTIRPIANYAEFDQPGMLQKALGADGAAKVVAKITPTVVSNHSWVQTLNRNMSIVSNATTPPALVVVQDFQVLPGKNADFADIMTSEYLPALKKAGVKDFWVYGTNIGGPGGLVSTVRPIAKYAELDPQPGGGLLVRGGLSQEAAQRLTARRAALFSSTETNVYRYVPDLSYGMPPQIPAN